MVSNIKNISFESLWNRLPIHIRESMKNCLQDYYYHPEGDCETHTKLVFECAKKYNDIDLLIVAIFHDLGKPETQTIKVRNKDKKVDISKLPWKELKISNIGHEYKCEKYIDKYIHLYSDLTVNVDKIKEICLYHLKTHLYINNIMTNKTKRKNFENLKYFNDLIKFEDCDANSNKHIKNEYF